MPEQITIICPSCAYSRTVPRHAIPEGARQATCPRCRQAFPLNDHTSQVRTEPEAATGSIPADASPLPASGPGSAPPAQAPIAPQSPPRPTPRTLGFSFQGSAGDYFGIWIVNTLLKIVTIGIFSAWAKVRRRRFFYGSTTLHGQPFEYLADPMVLFRGWLVAAGAFILFSIGKQVSAPLSAGIALIIFIVFPWLLVRSRIFNAVNASHRNIRFGFRPDYRQAYLVFAGLPILAALSLGLLGPYMLYRQKKFMVENSSYGSVPFSFTATAKDFYILSFKVALSAIAAAALVAACATLCGAPLSAAVHDHFRTLGGLLIITILALPLLYFILMVYAQTAMANLCWNATNLGKGTFRSTLRTRDMSLLFATNALAIMFSLGLMTPWATVRLARYRFQRLELHTTNGLDEVVAAAGSGQAVGATGEEIGDLFDMSVDIAL
jgi:uncharacterized membrane protein YjgN (DUF898 family)